MKRLVSLVTTGILAFALAACSSSGPSAGFGSAASPITPRTMFETSEPSAWFLTFPNSHPEMSVPYVLYYFGGGHTDEVIDAIDHGMGGTSYISVGTFGDIGGYSDGELVQALFDYQLGDSSPQGLHTSCDIGLWVEPNGSGTAAASETLCLLRPGTAEKLDSIEIYGASDEVFTVGSSYYKGFMCENDQYLVRRFSSYDEAERAKFSLDEFTAEELEHFYAVPEEGLLVATASDECRSAHLASTGSDGGIEGESTAIEQIQQWALEQESSRG